MTELFQASAQWASRPADERFVSLTALFDHFDLIRSQSAERVVRSNALTFEPTADNRGLLVRGPSGHPFAPTHHAFGQLAQLAAAPAGYLRTMPSPIVADALNYGMKYQRTVDEIGVLLQRNGSDVLRAATGPKYGRVWCNDITSTLIDRFGDGTRGAWRVPGEFGKAIEITKANTTIYGSDRDMFVFLADEQHKIEVPNSRTGSGAEPLSRGFFCWNSEVGDKTLGIASFLFRYACCNRIVWGASGFKQISIRHTSGAPGRWLDEIEPVLTAYANGSARPVEDSIKAAQARKVTDVAEFLAERFGKRLAAPMMAVHQLEEGRPVETIWDAVQASTAYAKSLAHIDARVEIETRAGKLLELVAA
jgi:hypothetical protein